MKIFYFLLVIFSISSCAQVEHARLAVDVAALTARKIDVEAIYQVDIERKRLRALRCMDPALTPAALAAVYADPRLGSAWMNEFLRDCPQFAGFLGALASERLGEIQELRAKGLIQ